MLVGRPLSGKKIVAITVNGSSVLENDTDSGLLLAWRKLQHITLIEHAKSGFGRDFPTAKLHTNNRDATPGKWGAGALCFTSAGGYCVGIQACFSVVDNSPSQRDPSVCSLSSVLAL